MFPIDVPSDGLNEPTLWWLFWFAISFVLYAGLAIWFYRVGKKETRKPEAASQEKSGV